MTLYHLSVKIIGRGSGRSAIGAAAYRAGGKKINGGKIGGISGRDGAEGGWRGNNPRLHQRRRRSA
jgi:hypothetical protein